MIGIVMAAATIATATAQDTSVYQNKEFDLEFTYPSSWQMETKALETSFVVPLEGTQRTATLQVFSALYRGPAEDWQTLQKDINEQMGRNVVRQWQETLMGVPLLLTQIEFEMGGEALTTHIGLLYAASANKMLFRLTAPTVVFPAADAAFRNVWPTLRTLSGSLPGREDPANRQDPPVVREPTRPPRVTVITEDDVNRPIQKAPEQLEIEIGGESYVLYYPRGWKATAGDGNRVSLEHPELGAPLVVSLNGPSADAPTRALFIRSSESLERFSRVTTRQEPQPRRNRGGAQVGWVLREGASSTGPLITWEAFGWLGGSYWIFGYSTESPADFSRRRRFVEELIDQMTFEKKSA